MLRKLTQLHHVQLCSERHVTLARGAIVVLKVDAEQAEAFRHIGLLCSRSLPTQNQRRLLKIRKAFMYIHVKGIAVHLVMVSVQRQSFPWLLLRCSTSPAA